MSARLLVTLVAFVAVVLVGALGAALNDAVLEDLQERRLQGGMDALRAGLETRLRIGLALAGNEQAQALLEEALAHMPMLDAIEIDSPDGIVLASTDRALRGQPVPASWREAARAQPERWHTARRDEHSVGVRLRDAFGQPAGYLTFTHGQLREARAPRALLAAVLAIAAAAAALTLLGALAADRAARARRSLDLVRLQLADTTAEDAVSRAARILAQARMDLAQVDRDVHRVAGMEIG